MLDVTKVCGLLDSWLSLLLLSTFRNEIKFGLLKALSIRLRDSQKQGEQEAILTHMQVLIGFGRGSLYDMVPLSRQDIKVDFSDFALHKAYIDELNLVSEEIRRLLPW